MEEKWKLRRAKNEDSASLVELVGTVYREYGDEVDVDGFDRDLLAVEDHYSDKGGEFVVLEAQGRVVGAHATQPVDRGEGLVTFRRLYLFRDFRGCGAGKLLMDWALDWSRERGFRRVEFWSDTRFERAHRFFASYGFKRGGVRQVTEGRLSFFEHFFARDL